MAKATRIEAVLIHALVSYKHNPVNLVRALRRQLDETDADSQLEGLVHPCLLKEAQKKAPAPKSSSKPVKK